MKKERLKKERGNNNNNQHDSRTNWSVVWVTQKRERRTVEEKDSTKTWGKNEWWIESRRRNGWIRSRRQFRGFKARLFWRRPACPSVCRILWLKGLDFSRESDGRVVPQLMVFNSLFWGIKLWVGHPWIMYAVDQMALWQTFNYKLYMAKLPLSMFLKTPHTFVWMFC